MSTEEKWKTTEKFIAWTLQIQEMNKILKAIDLKLKSKIDTKKTRIYNKKKKKHSNFDKTKNRKDFKSWKRFPLTGGKNKEKVWKVKRYFYCNEHQIWRRHKEKDCDKKKYRMR